MPSGRLLPVPGSCFKCKLFLYECGDASDIIRIGEEDLL
jgi:hypothetical protein